VKISVWLGASLAPLTAPILYLTVVMVFVPDTTPKHEGTWEAALVSLFLFLIPASYVVSIIFGAPLIYFLGRLEKRSFWRVTALAAPLGAIALICLLLVTMAFGATIQWARVGWEGVASFLCVGTGLGVVIAATFCFLAGITQRLDGKHLRRAP
jgi:hypothetical protein